MTKELPKERGKTIPESGHSMCKGPRTEIGAAKFQEQQWARLAMVQGGRRGRWGTPIQEAGGKG